MERLRRGLADHQPILAIDRDRADDLSVRHDRRAERLADRAVGRGLVLMPAAPAGLVGSFLPLSPVLQPGLGAGALVGLNPLNSIRIANFSLKKKRRPPPKSTARLVLEGIVSGIGVTPKLLTL